MDSFIPDELAVAPNSYGIAPNLKLVTVAIDAYTCFEQWVPTAPGTIMQEEGILLISDRPRLEDICARLTWLLGAQIPQLGEAAQSLAVRDWNTVLAHLQRTHLAFNALEVTYLPHTICPLQNRPSSEATADMAAPVTAWQFRPVGWNVSFVNLKPLGDVYEVCILPVNLVITAGQPITTPVLASAGVGCF